MKNTGVSSAKLLGVLKGLDKKFGKLDKKVDAIGKKVDVLDSRVVKLDSGIDELSVRTEAQERTSKRLEERMTSLGSWFRRFETQIEKRMSNFEERMNEMEGATKIVVNWGAMKSDLQDFATRNDLERMKFEIIEPIIKAVDKDAVTVVGHERRIGTLERKAGILAK